MTYRECALRRKGIGKQEVEAGKGAERAVLAAGLVQPDPMMSSGAQTICGIGSTVRQENNLFDPEPVSHLLQVVVAQGCSPEQVQPGLRATEHQSGKGDLSWASVASVSH